MDFMMVKRVEGNALVPVAIDLDHICLVQHSTIDLFKDTTRFVIAGFEDVYLEPHDAKRVCKAIGVDYDFLLKQVN